MYKVDFFLTQVIENYEDAKQLEITDVVHNIQRMKTSLESRLSGRNLSNFIIKKKMEDSLPVENKAIENIVKNTTRVLTDVLKKSLSGNVQNLTMNQKNNTLQNRWTKTLQQINEKSILREEKEKFTTFKKKLDIISSLLRSITDITERIRYFTQLIELLGDIKEEFSNVNLTVDEVNRTILDEQIKNAQIVINVYEKIPVC